MKSLKAAEDIAALIRARNPLIWIVTKEEERVERYVFEAAASAKYVTRFWDVASGVTEFGGKPTQFGGNDPGETLNVIRTRSLPNSFSDRAVWVMRDLAPWLAGSVGMTTLRSLRNLARSLPSAERERAQAIVVISPSGDIPPELSNVATVVEWPLPDREEIAEILDAAVAAQPDATQALNGSRDAAIDAALGLTEEEANACYARSLVQTRKVDPKVVASEKKRIVARERVLEWFDPIPGGLDAVGGLDNLKSWLSSRALAFSPEARAYGLPAPKGSLLVGVPGCGKTLFAKATATAWGVPLLKMDLGALKSKFVGESEGNLRKAFRVIEALGRCVVWLDEIEKSMAGATDGSADGGVSADALGAILNWMQERRGEAFVIATANDASRLPPELMRKGRFDEVWFVDLPNAVERAGVLAAALRANGRDKLKFNFGPVVDATENFTGAEIAALVPDAMFAAFADKQREITVTDLLEAAFSVVPLSTTASEKIVRLREWAKSRARSASAAVSGPKKARRVLDV